MALEPRLAHSWDVSTAVARDIQWDLRRHVRLEPRALQPAIVGCVDVSVRQGEARSAVVLPSFPGLELIEAVTVERPVSFPYVPGLPAFREGPVVLEAMKRLEPRPDVLVFDAHGLATHLGMLLEMSTVGCAKSRLCGNHTEPDAKRGSWRRLLYGDEVIGAVVRTREPWHARASRGTHARQRQTGIRLRRESPVPGRRRRAGAGVCAHLPPARDDALGPPDGGSRPRCHREHTSGR